MKGVKQQGLRWGEGIRNLLVALAFLALAGLSAAQSSADKTPPKLAIVIDDIGNSLSAGEAVIRLPLPLTLAVLPFTAHAHALAELGHRHHKEIMLHAPMSNIQGFRLGRGGLYDSMNETEFKTQLRRNIAAVPHLRGVNNHMGSLLTQNVEAMQWVMQTLNEFDLYFIDSRTIAATQAEAVAQQQTTPHRRRDVFLDHVQSISHTRDQLSRAITLAKQTGSALAIGHPYPSTLAVLREYSVNPDTHIQLVFASELVTPHTTHRITSRALRHSVSSSSVLSHCPMPAWMSLPPSREMLKSPIDIYSTVTYFHELSPN